MRSYVVVALSVCLTSSLVLAAGEGEQPAPDAAAEAEAKESAASPVTGRDAPYRLDPIIVTPTRAAESILNTPYSSSVVTDEEINRRQYRTVPQALRNIPGIMVQETAIKGGSPYIRGFTSFRNLFLIDGIRLNNSVYRDGPNQYWNTVDAQSLSQLEVFKGAGSVQYGSDAVGGTVNAITKNPYSYGTGIRIGDGVFGGGRGYYRFASAEHSHVARGEGSIGFGDHTGLLFGGTYKDFGDITAGDPTGRQTHTGYDEYNVDFKFEHFFNPDTRLVMLHQRVRQNNAPRTHKTVNAVSYLGTTNGGELQRDFDQERNLTYVQLHAEDIDLGWFDTFRASLSHHYQGEVRHRERTGDRTDFQGVDVDTIGFWTQIEGDTPIGRLMIGLDYYHDIVDSFSSGNSIQGPVADDSTYDLLGVFVQNKITPMDRLDFLLGMRFTYAGVHAGSVDVNDVAQSIDESWYDVSGSARAMYHIVPDRWNVFAGVSQAFRAPNLSDLSRDTDFGGGVEVPTPNLDPEHYIQFEVGTKAEYDQFSVQAAYFHTLTRDRILRVPLMSGDEVNKINADNGFIHGFEFGMAYRVLEELTLFGNFTWLDGEQDSLRADGTHFEDYPRRLMPPTGQVGLRYDSSNLPIWAETMVVIAGNAEKLSQGDIADTDRVPASGTPGYTLWHIRGGWHITDNVDLNLAVENITNEDYRIHGSGTNAPGRSAIVSVDVHF